MTNQQENIQKYETDGMNGNNFWIDLVSFPNRQK